MKKITGIMIAMLMMGVVLTGCYSKSCNQPAMYKDSATMNK